MGQRLRTQRDPLLSLVILRVSLRRLWKSLLWGVDHVEGALNRRVDFGRDEDDDHSQRHEEQHDEKTVHYLPPVRYLTPK